MARTHRRKIEIYDLCSVQAAANVWNILRDVPATNSFAFPLLNISSAANGRIAAIVSINSVLKLLLNKLFPSQFLKFLNKMFNLSQSWYLKFLRKLQFNLFPKKLQCNLILNNCSSTAHPENCSVKSL
uniref:Uncharacterized protein n=1 Tax=Daphnia galeata TaxID=27404 RepID=A0A8J2WDT1_9CRUS|nr:unnamed protein product [Daphnia galeata]